MRGQTRTSLKREAAIQDELVCLAGRCHHDLNLVGPRSQNWCPEVDDPPGVVHEWLLRRGYNAKLSKRLDIQRSQ